jgi:hypothetical protein
MRFMIPKFVLAAVVITTAATLTTHSAKAETTLNVPFSFTVAGQSMPAGLYSVEQDVFHNTVILRSKQDSKSFSAVLVPGDPSPSELHIALTFETSGGTHSLKTIQYGGRITSRLNQAPRESFEPSRLSQGR